nr:aminotransferase class III-fold pyridoxal phosphate-dependent enzyme [Angustibacter aerolatus]
MVVDVDGNSLVDLGSGIAVVNVGNANPRVVERVQQQVAAFTHTCFMVTPYAGYVEVCEALARLTPGDHAKKSALFNSGAEAVENAVKIARAATRRDAVVVFDHAYHGRTNLTMAMTAKSMPYKHGFGPFAGEVYRAPMSLPLPRAGPDQRRRGGGPGDRRHREAGRRRRRGLRGDRAGAGRGRLRGAGRRVPAGDRRLVHRERRGVRGRRDPDGLRAHRRDVRLRARGRGARPHHHRQGHRRGLPLAAVTGRAERWTPCTPAASAAPTAATRSPAPRRSAPSSRSRTTTCPAGPPGSASLMTERLHQIAGGNPQIGEVRGRGAMVAIEVVQPGTTEPDAAEAARISAACHAAGVVTLTCGTYGNVLRLLPPLVIGEDLLTEALDVLAEAVAG